MRKLSILFLVFFVHQSQATESFLDLNDVSILLPLPTAEEWNQLPRGATEGKKGLLLPVSYLKTMPRLISDDTNQKMYSYLRVVGIRLDPCFHEGRLPMRCRAQIRLVWQPLRLVEKITSTFDASLHSFYDLSRDDFSQLIREVAELKKTKTEKNEFLPLGINPFIKADGLNGEYSKKLFQIVTNYIGDSNLTRVTFMQLFMNEMVWMFGGLDIANGEVTPIQIARLRTNSQLFGNSASPRPFWFLGGMNPEPTEEENLNILVKDSRILAPQNEDAIIAAAKAAFRFENPELHNPGTVDCVSCHVAQAAKTWALRQYPWMQLDLVNEKEIYTSDRDLRNLSPMQVHTNILRTFGYFMNRPFVAQRTINESAAVIKYINENF